MPMDIDDNMEDFLVEEKRHRELISTIKEIIKDIPKTDIDLSPLKSIQKYIEKISVNEKPEGNKILVESIQKLNDNFIQKLNELKESIKELNKPKEYEFTIKRDNIQGFIEKVVVKNK